MSDQIGRMGHLAYRKILRLLRFEKLQFKIHKHAPVITMRDVEEKLLFSQQALVKTQVFRIQESDWVLTALRACDKIDYSKLAAALSVSRRLLLRPTMTEIQLALGFEEGGISPISFSQDVKVVFDQNLSGMGTVYCGVGRNDRTLEIDVDVLVHLSGALVQSITTVGEKKDKATE